MAYAGIIDSIQIRPDGSKARRVLTKGVSLTIPPVTPNGSNPIFSATPPTKFRLQWGEIRSSSHGASHFNWEDRPAAARDPKVLGGAWVFRGTRVPLYALFENLKGGASTTEFVDWFPNVTKQQVDAVLDFQVRFLRQSRAE